MSYRTIAAALALEDVSVGERLVAFSLASFADPEHQTFVGNTAAAARAGLSRSQYLAARERLQTRGLISVAAGGGGRGRSATLTLAFADRGPWREERVNPQLFGTVLGYTRARGPARVLLATLAALAGEERQVVDVTTEEVLAAAGLSDRTYRRARAALLASGELVAESCAGGRGNTNRWRLADPRSLGTPLPARRRIAPPGNARPLVGPATPVVAEVENRGQDRTVSAMNPGQDRTLSALNPGQDRTVSRHQTPAETPAETPAPNAHAGSEPGNQKNEHPPSPPAGGSAAGAVPIVEDFLTDRGRKRRRSVLVSLDDAAAQLRPPDADAQRCFERLRNELRRIVGDSRFEIWLEPLALVAVEPSGELVLAVPVQMRSWVSARFAGVLDRAGRAVERCWRLADERDLQLLDALGRRPPPSSPDQTNHLQKEAV